MSDAFPTLKRCTGCGESKPLDAFHNDRHRPDGKTTRCKECNKMASNAYAAKRRVEDPLWNRAYFLDYQALHRDYFNDYQARWLAASSVTAQRNKDQQETWRADHPDEVRSYGMVRRARKIGASVNETILRSEVAERGGWICALCGDPIDPNGTYRLADGSYNPWYLHVDHIVPLIQGGDNSYANTQPSHARCNLKKSKGRRKVIQ